MGDPPGPGAVPSAQLTPGSVYAGRYRVVRLLGTGGMGVVYEATPISPLARPVSQPPKPVSQPPKPVSQPPRPLPEGKNVALKVLHRHLVANVQITRRFHREAGILTRVTGEHLVPLLDFGQDEGQRLYMALELVDGDSLDRHVGVVGLLSVRDAVDVVMQIATALDSTHRAGVVHRDLKPGNVLLEKKPGGMRVRVCDFGLAKVLGEQGVASTALTDQNMVFGTPEYMSPEQIKGEDLDPRCDIYAAGVILYELLTGRVPFSAKTGVATMTEHIVGELEPPRSRAPKRAISPALEAVTLHAMARAKEDRYPSAPALRSALAHALAFPDDVAAVKPPPAEPDIAQRDTDFAIRVPSSHPIPVDPLGSTEEITPGLAAHIRTLSDAAAARNRSSGPAPPRPRSSAPTPPRTSSGPPGRGQVTPESLAPPPPPITRPWMWIVVATIAAAIGIGVGIMLAR